MPKNKRLSDFTMEDIVGEVVKDTKAYFENHYSDSLEDVVDVSFALGKSLEKWMPYMLTNIAEDAMKKLGYFKDDYYKFADSIETAVGYSHKD